MLFSNFTKACIIIQQHNRHSSLSKTYLRSNVSDFSYRIGQTCYIQIFAGINAAFAYLTLAYLSTADLSARICIFLYLTRAGQKQKHLFPNLPPVWNNLAHINLTVCGSDVGKANVNPFKVQNVGMGVRHSSDKRYTVLSSRLLLQGVYQPLISMFI